MTLEDAIERGAVLGDEQSIEPTAFVADCQRCDFYRVFEDALFSGAPPERRAKASAAGHKSRTAHSVDVDEVPISQIDR